MIILPSSTCRDKLSAGKLRRRLSSSSDEDSTTADTAEWSTSSGESFASIFSTKTDCSIRSILRTSEHREEKPPHPTKHKEVRFGTVLVRDYEIILGDHPCCSFGPPLTIDWDYQEGEPLDVDSYEAENALSRLTRERGSMHLNYFARKYLLREHYTEQDFKSAIKEINRIKMNRTITSKLANYHDVVESACQKLKRVIPKHR